MERVGLPAIRGLLMAALSGTCAGGAEHDDF